MSSSSATPTATTVADGKKPAKEPREIITVTGDIHGDVSFIILITLLFSTIHFYHEQSICNNNSSDHEVKCNDESDHSLFVISLFFLMNIIIFLSSLLFTKDTLIYRKVSEYCLYSIESGDINDFVGCDPIPNPLTLPQDYPLTPLQKIFRVILMFQDIFHHLPSSVPLIPKMAPWMPKMLPIVPDIAPHMDKLLVHKEFLAENVGVLLTRRELLPDMVRLLAPTFPELTKEQLDVMHKLLPEFMLKLHLILPHAAILRPHLKEVVKHMEKLLPHMDVMLQYIDDLKDDLGWLLDFADLDDFDDLVRQMPLLAPHIHKFRPYAPKLKKNIKAMGPYMPEMIRNIDAMEPVLPDLIDHIDPLLSNLGPMLPLADKLGLLGSSTLMKLTPPIARILPPSGKEDPTTYPLVAYTNENAITNWRSTSKDKVKIVEYHKCFTKISSTPKIFYVVHVNGEYYGEFRYSDFHKLHEELKKAFGSDYRYRYFSHHVPFPSRSTSGDQRKDMLEQYLQELIGSSPSGPIINSNLLVSRLSHRAKVVRPAVAEST